MEQATKDLLEDFGFADENELIQWSQTLIFDVRWCYSEDGGPENFEGWPSMLVTDGDCGICLITSDSNDTIQVEPVGCNYSSISYECIDNFRLAVDESNRDWIECYEDEFRLKNVSCETQ